MSPRKYVYKVSDRRMQPDRPHAPAPVAFFVGKPNETKQLAGRFQLNEYEFNELNEILSNPISSKVAKEGDEIPIHWAEYDNLSVAITRSEVDGKLLIVLENLEEEPIAVRVSRDSDDNPIWEGTVE